MAVSPATDKNRSSLRSLRLCGEKSSFFFDLLLLAAIEVFMMAFLDVRYLFYDTVVTGGDAASWQGIAHHLLYELLPNGRLTGWDMGNFCGYPNFSFYFIPPFLLGVLPSFLFDIPLTISLKFAIASGIFLFPVMVYLGLRDMGYRFPGPVIGAAASMLPLFNEMQTMFGGNVLSTNSGEFCYMFAFALFAWFIGSAYRGVEKGEGAIRNGVLLGLIGLSHLFVFVPAVCVMIYLFLAKGRFGYLTRVSLVGFGLMAFWILPLLAYRHPYTTPVYMIWHDFVNWRYTFMGIAFLLLLTGPRIALGALGRIRNPLSTHAWGRALVAIAGLGAFTLVYLGGTWLVHGKGLFDHGLHITMISASPIGPTAGGLFAPMVVPFALAAALAVAAVGVRSHRSPSEYESFCRITGTLFFTGCVLFASIGLHHFLGRSIPSPAVKGFVLRTPTMIVVHCLIAAGTIWLLSRKGFRERSLLIAGDLASSRLGLFLGLGFGCILLYFAAHFLQVPDIRFLPPLGLALFFILFAETLEPFLSQVSGTAKVGAALLVTYGCLLAVIFGTTRADVWFRYNNRGYEHNAGYRDFKAANLYLRTADPLNAPRVGYEKCSLYGIYGGDRVFESLPYFSGRQTMEGIHYASASSSKFVTFFQTLYSKEIKVPRAYILSRMNAAGLPAYMNLYNVSQLILMTREARESADGSPHLEKEAAFGNIAIYRHKGSDGRYVDVPRRRPLLYGGDDWVGDFYRWYQSGRYLDLLMVPRGYVKDEEDRALLGPEVRDAGELGDLRSDLLDTRGLRVESRLEHQKIEFTTNKVGLPHLIKVSYFPNWKVRGANGVYPVSPHLMMVIPREPHVVLTYGSNPWETIGYWITGITLMLLLALAGRKILHSAKRIAHSVRGKEHSAKRIAHGARSKEVFTAESQRTQRGAISFQWREMPPLEKLPRFAEIGFCLTSSPVRQKNRVSLRTLRLCGENLFSFLDHGRVRRWLTGLALLAAVGLIAGGAAGRDRAVRGHVQGNRLYQTGLELKRQGKEEAARRHFEKAVRVMSPVFDPVPIDDHHDVIHCMILTAASYENLGERERAEVLYQGILEEYPFSRYVAEAHVRIGRIRRNEGKTAEAKEHFERAIREEPWSVWAKYAREDLKAAGSRQ